MLGERAAVLRLAPAAFTPLAGRLGGSHLPRWHKHENCAYTRRGLPRLQLTLVLRNGRAEVQRCMSSCTLATVTVQSPAAIELAPSPDDGGPGNAVRI
jgi:hypothetical protein